MRRCQLAAGGQPSSGAVVPLGLPRRASDHGLLRGSSYVSRKWVDGHRWAVRSSREVNDTVTLGDGATSIAVNEEVQLLMELKGPSGIRKSEAVNFRVMDAGFDFIVGLPDLEEKPLEVFIDLLRMGAARRAKCKRVEALKDMDSDAVTLVDLGNALYYVQGFRSISSRHEFVVDSSSYVTELETATPKPSDMMEAWTSLASHAPEMDDLYVPSNFTEALNHMDSSAEERRNKFKKDQKKH